jgi:hypothetical protein
VDKLTAGQQRNHFMLIASSRNLHLCAGDMDDKIAWMREIDNLLKKRRRDPLKVAASYNGVRKKKMSTVILQVGERGGRTDALLSALLSVLGGD